MATNPVDLLPDADAVEQALARLPVRRRLRRVVRDTDTIRPPCPAAGGRLGREGRHRHQFGAAHLAPAPVSARARAKRGRTGGSSPRSAKRMGFGEAFDYWVAAEIFAEHAALSGIRERWRARFRYRCFRGNRPAKITGCEPFQWPRPRPRGARQTRFFAMAGSSPRTARRDFVAVRAPRDAPHQSRLPARSEHRPRPRPLAHHDADRQKRAAVAAHRRALRRDPSGRCAAPRYPDAESCASRARVATCWCARCSRRAKRARLFVPMHWTDQFASAARVDTLVPAIADPHSGQPASKCVPVGISRPLCRREIRLCR